MDFQKLASDGKQVVISSDSVLSPSAVDLAKQMRVEIMRDNTSTQLLTLDKRGIVEMTPTMTAEKCARQEKIVESDSMVAEGDLPAIIRKVLAEVLKPACSNPQVTHIQSDEVVLDVFDQAPTGQKVMMKDVVTAREGNLCAGFMSYAHSQMPWKLTYDEVDYVVEGVFTLQVGDKTYTCHRGDVLYIPKNTAVVFGSPTQTKVFYVTYPANWAELK
jgi:ethanolamine utilization protein EutQ